jgi:hypothetical protein
LELPSCKQALDKIFPFAIGSLGRPAGAGGAIPARPVALRSREGVEEGLGVARVRFRGLAGPVAAPVSDAPVGRKGRPPRLLLAGEGGSGIRIGEARSTHVC